MSAINDLMNISGSGLQAYQNQINVYGNNIANVDTDGYSRRQIGLEAGATNFSGLGSGVRAGDVTRLFNALGQNALLGEQSTLGYHAATASYLSQLETLVGSEGASGLEAALASYQDSLQDVITSPSDLSVRTSLLQRASSLASELNQLDGRIQDILADDGLLGSAGSVVDDINSLTEQLQVVNKSISKAEAMGRTVPDLLDQRDQLVRELSEQVNITVSADYSISLGGEELVSSDGSTRSELVVDAANVFTVNGNDVSASISSGRLGGFLVAQNAAKTLSSQLDALAGALITQTNAAFDGAYNLNGAHPSDEGYTFFTGTDAGDIAVDAALYNPDNPLDVHPELLALGTTAYAGDNSAAQAMYSVTQLASSDLGGQSISGFWSYVESSLGGAVSEALQMEENSQAVVDSLENEMLSVSGVNMDEELMNLMSAQKAYQACARVMSTATDLLDELINLAR